jgi:hypothetical protein
MIVNKDKWLANLLDDESSLCRHLEFVSCNEVDESGYLSMRNR